MADERDSRDMPDNTPRVAPLGKLDDFQVADGVPDPRGWDVIASDGMKAGEVHELIVDTAVMCTRYLDIKLDKDIAGDGDDRDVMLPVGAARLDDNDDRVILDNMTTAQIAALPVYTHDAITRDYENSVLGRMPGSTTGAATGALAGGTATAATRSADDDNYYSSHHFDDSRLFAPRNADRTTTGERKAEEGADSARLVRSEEELDIGKRQVQSGDVEVRKTVETEHVHRPVTVRREQVTIERRPVSADRVASGNTNISQTGDEIHIPVIEEEVVVETRPVVKEEIVIRKHAVSEDKTVEADLRRERIDVDRSGMRDARDAGDARNQDSEKDRTTRP